MKVEVELTYQHGNDLCLSFWAIAMAEKWISFPEHAKVLEIGCAEADWQTPMLKMRPDLQITGIDWRECTRPGLTLQGDVMNLTQFNDGEFDAIVSISAIEHVGLSAYEDPRERFGDALTMVNARRWLKPGGWMYLDVPYSEGAFEVNANYRRYNEQALAERITKAWTIRHRSQIQAEHPDSPYIALLLEKA